MTVAAIMGGLLPIMWTAGTGADVMKRIAAPMVGGLLTSAFLTLEIIPVIYTYWRHEQLLWERLAERSDRVLGRLRAEAWGTGGAGFTVAAAGIVGILVSAAWGMTVAWALLGLGLVAGVASLVLYFRDRHHAVRTLATAGVRW